MSAAASNDGRNLSRLSLLAGSALALQALVSILVLNHGHFSFSLDDPYIHLRLAENIGRGTYGINPGEVAAPSSSILWPFLLVPFLALGLGQYSALLINFCAFAANCLIVGSLLGRIIPMARRPYMALTAVIAVLCSLNFVGLLFTGMEHSLQVTLALASVLGMHKFLQDDKPAPWWLACLVLDPLIRYENLPLLLAASLVMILRHHWKPAAMVLILGLGATALFSVFLIKSGLPPLPSSVLVKSGAVGSVVGNHFAAFLGGMLSNAAGNLAAENGIPIVVALWCLAWPPVSDLVQRRREWVHSDRAMLGLFCVLAILAHLLLGQAGWFARYEIYVLAIAFAGLILIYGEMLGHVFSRIQGWQVALALPAVIVSFQACWAATFKTPLACSNIQNQQYQMHRFAIDYYKGPVAVNDLGWVSYENPGYVLDLGGLGSYQAFLARTVSNESASWVDDLASRYNVQLAMVYADWVTMPPTWHKVATLNLLGPVVTPAHSVSAAHEVAVTFFASPDADLPRIRAELVKFRSTLPGGAALQMP